MDQEKAKQELVNYVVSSTQHVVLHDPVSLLPVGSGSGMLLIYRERLFFVSVQHIVKKEGKRAALDTGVSNNVQGTKVYMLPALNFVDQHSFEGFDTDDPILKELGPLDICFTEINEPLDIKQKEINFGSYLVQAGEKNMIFTNLDYSPTFEEGYSFFGRTRSQFIDNTLIQNEHLVLGMKYDQRIGSFERFILDQPITDALDFKGTSGAPIFSETGEPVAFVAHGSVGKKFLYGFSAWELRKFLDIHIDLDQPDEVIYDGGSKEGHSDESSMEEDDIILFDSDFEDSLGPGRGVTFDHTMEESQVSMPVSSAQPDPEYVIYPVLYGTNRKATLSTKAKHFSKIRDKQLHLGICKISIPSDHHMGNLERPSWFHNLFFNPSPNKHFTVLSNEEITQSDFLATLRAAEEKDILLFIHGFNVEFDESMHRAAQLGYDLNFKGSVVAFSWASYGAVHAYVGDTDSAKFSATYLAQLLEILLITEPGKLHIIAHSMGNVVLMEALIQLKGKGLFPSPAIQQIVLAAPDIDKDIFTDQIVPAIKCDTRYTLYASAKDQALFLSKKIRQGYNRAGDGGENITIVDGVESIDASQVDTSLLGHGYFADTKPLLYDIHSVLEGAVPASRILTEKSKQIGNTTKKYWIFRNS